MATKEQLEAVFASNRAILKRAAELNARAGETIFRIPSFDELTTQMKARLAGARSIAEIRDVDALRLPGLDAALVLKDLADNPDTIVVLGQEVSVEYRVPYYGGMYAPRIVLSAETVAAKQWLELPDEGVRLPGGRSVEISLAGIVSNVDIVALKRDMRVYVDRTAWNNWARPEITIPDMADESATIPEIVEACYGTSMVDGKPLIAFGTVKRTWSGTLVGFWTTKREEAEDARRVVVERFEEDSEAAAASRERLRKEALEREALEEARTAAWTVQGDVRAAQKRAYEAGLGGEVRELLYRASHGFLPMSLDGLLTWTAETRALIERADAQIEAEREAKAADAELCKKLAEEAEAIATKGSNLLRASINGEYLILGTLRTELESKVFADRQPVSYRLREWIADATALVAKAEAVKAEAERKARENFDLDAAKAALMKKFQNF